MDIGLRGKTAIVAGSTSGLGLAVGRALDAEGANVVISGRRGDVAEREAARLSNGRGLEVDLAAPDAPDRLVAAALDHFGQVDVLVLNSGGPPPSTAKDMSPDHLEKALHQLVTQQIRLVSLVLPGMCDRGWGRIVAIGSSGVQQPIENLALSNVARAGLAAYLKTLSSEVAALGVTVNMVLPGRIDTARVVQIDAGRAEREGVSAEEARRRSQAAIPMGRYGTPEEFAAVVAFLCGEPASYVTGAQIRCDGGLVGSL
ncbi:SDR family oxidoreductase [Actinomadura sp. HBU206391]|uniref:SDR family oxidoreductase n=1 Tax=Actinomadura sp. HBU206391 TaxID=2731692 RepID=UPI00164EE870|nr:SDR family oxidoreductase [Actinomadura sp. HBU206391]MBC6461902.1 SDR family oxidoreductase [Actinomadura sp. HBU206391]